MVQNIREQTELISYEAISNTNCKPTELDHSVLAGLTLNSDDLSRGYPESTDVMRSYRDPPGGVEGLALAGWFTMQDQPQIEEKNAIFDISCDVNQL
jgi:hypothetical protein